MHRIHAHSKLVRSLPTSISSSSSPSLLQSKYLSDTIKQINNQWNRNITYKTIIETASTSSRTPSSSVSPSSFSPSSPVIDRIVSGIQPSGILHLGNYLGAVRAWVKMQGNEKTNSTTNSHNLFLFLADLHALTLRPSSSSLSSGILSLTAQLLSCGIESNKCVLFPQSQIKAHAELCWLLSCFTPHSWLTRMTQFKDKSKQLSGTDQLSRPGGKEGAMPSHGLFSYPVLQAADILLYNATSVPVGSDQKQHIELCRDIATQFNNFYSSPDSIQFSSSSSQTTPFKFTIPRVVLQPTSRIMSLRSPLNKMSKSDMNDNSRINIIDSNDLIRDKVRKAVTDSEGGVSYDREKRPGVSNLLDLIIALSADNQYSSVEELIKKENFSTSSQVKEYLTQSIITTITPIRNEFQRIEKDKNYLNQVLKKGSEIANEEAENTISKVKATMGLPRYF